MGDSRENIEGRAGLIDGHINTTALPNVQRTQMHLSTELLSEVYERTSKKVGALKMPTKRTRRQKPLRTKKFKNLVSSRPTPGQRAEWTEEDVKHLSTLLTKTKAQTRFEETAKRPAVDKARIARRVAPSTPETSNEINQQMQWYRNPQRMDLEGIDAPEGTATDAPTPKVRERAVPNVRSVLDTQVTLERSQTIDGILYELLRGTESCVSAPK